MRTQTTNVFAAGALLGGAVAVLLASAPLQTNPTPPAAPAPPTAVTEEQIKADTYAAMTLLSQLIGRWDVTGQSFEPDGTPAETFTGGANFALAMGENFVAGDWTLQSGQFVLEQMDYFGYSPGLRRFTHTMLTQLDKSMVYQQGVWLPESGTLSFTMAAPLETPRGQPRSVGLEYSFVPGGNVAVTMTMQRGAGALRTVRMMLTPSQQPAAPTGPGGMPNGGIPAMQTANASPEQMQQALAQMNAQKQAMQQYMATMKKQAQAMSEQLK